MKNFFSSGRRAEVHNEKLELPGGPRRYTKRILNVREARGGSLKKFSLRASRDGIGIGFSWVSVVHWYRYWYLTDIAEVV